LRQDARNQRREFAAAQADSWDRVDDPDADAFFDDEPLAHFRLEDDD